jgi:hypothetical protein
MTRRSFRPESIPPPLLDRDLDARRFPVLAQKVLGESEPEFLDLPAEPVLRERVDGVLHRVGGEHAGVVSRDVRGFEIAFESNRDRQVGNVVPAGAAIEADEPDPRLPVAVGAERQGQVPRYVEYPKGESSSGT